jgi:ribosomal protein S18 acetylase RimI-like enzyme
MSVLSDYRQRGVGKKLIQAALIFAQKFLVRVELTVAVTNQPAINLYLQSGFKKEGVLRKNCVASDGYVDEIIMSFLSKPNQGNQ